MVKKATGTAGGKVILFGEHFVVHGCPAVALGISNSAVVEITKSDKIGFKTKAKGTIPELTSKAISNVLSAMEIQDKFLVELKGDLPTVGGLGSSAAFCVALARAVSAFYNIKLTNEQINEIAYEGELAFHGTPSGIDNSIATFGGAIKFTKSESGNKFEKLSIPKELHFVLGLTGVSSPTSKMVAKVHEFRKKNPEKFQELFKKAEEIVQQGIKLLELESATFEELGKLMDKNQQLLLSIGVSIPENEQVITLMHENGAYGAKITGGGGGGTCLALVKDKKHAEQIISKLTEKGFSGIYSKYSP
ncbi:mevalonate kinase [Candidatus Micrarchaeota archaeon]|nr:mevalonate kinase [Candidatus Micrarchaeota archaeon]